MRAPTRSRDTADTPMARTDVEALVVGGGIVGLAVADAWLARHPGGSLVVLEKEPRVAEHQTGRNSGVIHSGIYYVPGSLKARLCRRGRALLIDLCREAGVAHEICGKVIVAVDDAEAARLSTLSERAVANGVTARRIARDELVAREPHVAGVAALEVDDSGIVDYRGVCDALVARIRARGGEVLCGRRVVGLERGGAGGARVRTADGEAWDARRVVNCAGLHADRVMARAGSVRPARVVPFRGEYFELTPAARRLCRHLVYPVSDPAFPFLGVHLTRMVDGSVECGPNAVLALAREGYTWGDVSLRDVADVFGYVGFWRLAARHWRAGALEAWRSLSRAAFVRALQRLVPEITSDDLVPAPAGVRAQALAPDGALVDDFLVEDDGAVLHVLNAPSPAATASLAIGEHVATLAAR